MSRDAGMRMAKLVHQIVQTLVDHAIAVKVSGELREGSVVINVTVAESDIGYVIGKQGRTARSLRTILMGASRASGVRCELNIIGDPVGKP